MERIIRGATRCKKSSFFIFLLFALPGFAQQYNITSPNKNITVQVSNAAGVRYSVVYNGKTVILPSPLGFELKNEPAMKGGFTVLSQEETTFNETWEPVIKIKHAAVVNHYNELNLQLAEKDSLMRHLRLCFRVYDDGVAFRYTLYRSEKPGNRQITKELTGFRFAGDQKAWMAEYKGGYSSSQEAEFAARTLTDMHISTRAGLPLLTKVNENTWAAITEAEIDNYPGFYLGASRQADSSITLFTKLAPLPHEPEDGVKARFDDSLPTPWRVIMLAATPGKLIESEIVQNLNKPCVIADPSWIKPGMSAWDHWWSGEVKMDMPTIKTYIDYASREGWPYMLIDWQWYGPFNQPVADITKPAAQLNMPEILQYAAAKKVRCWLWLYSADVNRNNNFEKAFALYESWGIAGIKIDFMDRDDQEMVNWYHQIIKAAAAHHLLVDFHGAYKPDGITRTYPNMITREGVMGEEYYKFSNRMTPEHNTTLPFTRMLAGPMDYTPGGFLNVTQKQFKQQTPTLVSNTRCAELAKFVVYESPFMVNCEKPENVYGQPGENFLQQVPTTWDDTQVLDGYPGEFVAIARRSGNSWFIGALNNSKGRTLKVPTGFLSAGNYQLQIWTDAKDADVDPKKVQQSTITLKAGTPLTIGMSNAGGYVAIIKPITINPDHAK
ncbi:glycoside hydrolase family 97 protein [Chitinophaga sp. GbtcB8]|uniref:glycoside hydrolase family 97 protein n=1 Tax=Chitinophaga sp. GbtcB8 TaxID=2824753 RepID=UPI001C30F5E9|nr:glycoside hydrolase family 97 protein [Chitinophaga sp. GbtcB8]